MENKPANIYSTFLRLGADSRIEELPVDETFWPRLIEGQLGTFHKEYLVTTSQFAEDWPTWEIHPKGDEVVVLLSGKVTFVMETDVGNVNKTLTTAGDFVFVPEGTWHTAHVDEPTALLFITAGEGTRVRPA